MSKNSFKPDMGTIVQSLYGSIAFTLATAMLAFIWNQFDTWGVKRTMPPISALLFNVLLAIGVITVVYLVMRSMAKLLTKQEPETKQEMTEVVSRHLTKEVVLLDNHTFINCFIDNCRVRYNGGQYVLRDTKIRNITFESKNPTVVNTVITLNSLGYLEEEFSKEWRVVPQEYLTQGMPLVSPMKVDTYEKDSK